MKAKNSTVIICFLAGMALLACNRDKAPAEKNLDALVQEQQNARELPGGMDQQVLDAIIQSIPSPLELAAVIRSSGQEFNETLLCPEKDADDLDNAGHQAFHIGVYGGDLGYINMYEKSYQALQTLGTIKSLAEELRVGHFFDFGTIRRMASNADKIDSLIYISTSNFNRMNDYLRSQQRSELSALILAGSWMEALYLATEIAGSRKDEQLVERIGEQKLVLEQIMLVLDAYREDPDVARVAASFDRILEAYGPVSIEYIDAEPETKEVDGRLVIVSNSSTQVLITEKDLAGLRKVVAEERASLLTPA